jgi:L-amino acid N-acyltransferase YncA
MIRTARAADAESIAMVHARSWRTAYRGLLPERFLRGLAEELLTARWHRRLETHSRRHGVWVVEIDRVVVGFATACACYSDAALVGFAGEVEMLYLLPEHQGRGYGRQLFDHVLAALGNEGFHWVIVWVLAANGPARRFYEAHGFRLDGARRVDLIRNERIAVVRYARALNPVVDFDALRRELAP